MTRISNYVEVTHALARKSFLQPDGTNEKVLVDNPRLTSDAPKMLRVSVPRKGFTFKVIEEAREMRLRVGDVWQHDQDKKEDRVMLKLEPEEQEDAPEKWPQVASL
jgi:hypothetical protein